MNAEKKIDIIIINWKKYDLTLNCIDSVLKSSYKNFKKVDCFSFILWFPKIVPYAKNLKGILEVLFASFCLREPDAAFLGLANFSFKFLKSLFCINTSPLISISFGKSFPKKNTWEDFRLKKKYKNVDALTRARERQDVTAISLKQSHQLLNERRRKETYMTTNTAYNLLKQDEEVKRMNKKWWMEFKQLDNH